MWRIQHKHLLRRVRSFSPNRQMGLFQISPAEPGPVPIDRSRRLVPTLCGKTISETRTKKFCNGPIRGSNTGMSGGFPTVATGSHGGMETVTVCSNGGVIRVQRFQEEGADIFKVLNGKAVWTTAQCTTMFCTTRIPTP